MNEHHRVDILLTELKLNNIEYYICVSENEHKQKGVDLSSMVAKGALPNYLIEKGV